MFLLKMQLQQYLPLAVLKRIRFKESFYYSSAVAAVLTVYGIETLLPMINRLHRILLRLQQYLPFTICDEGCEEAEERSDDEVRTSLVPDRREGKTKVMKQQYLPFTVCDLSISNLKLHIYY